MNSAGQAHAWARTAERLPGVAAYSFAIQPPEDRFRFPVDGRVPSADYAHNAVWRRRQQRDVVSRFTHVLLESGRGAWGGDVAEEIRAMRSAGARVGLLFHGSDIRIPHVHAQLEPDSPFTGGRYPGTAALEERTAANHRLVETSGCPTFVSTPQLLDFLPDATWLPVVVDPAPWRQAAQDAPLVRERPIVVHAPSRRGLKGSEAVAAALERLDRAGAITYREVTGVPASQMPSLYGGADIVLDQFVNGGYGVAACEAMAAGRVVLAHVSPRHREAVRRVAGTDLPVIEATTGDIGEVIERILADRETFGEAAARGPAFVTRLHDGRASAETLSRFLEVGA